MTGVEKAVRRRTANRRDLFFMLVNQELDFFRFFMVKNGKNLLVNLVYVLSVKLFYCIMISNDHARRYKPLKINLLHR